MPEKSGQFTISEQQNNEFAALSGDYNPLHVDAIYSRRLQFGQPVIHGIHHLLRTWDAACSSLPSFPKTPLIKLSANFLNPVSINQAIKYHCETHPDQLSAVLTAHCKDKKILSLALQFSGTTRTVEEHPVSDTSPPIEASIDQKFPPPHSTGTCQLCLNVTLANGLFNNLLNYLPAYQLAQILACTRVVGMRCPGLNSIFSKVMLQFNPDISVADNGSLRYFEIHKDARVNIVKLGVEARGMKGSLDTFFRPSPVIQPSYVDVRSEIPENIFSKQRALVIGGSRGIGETTAKILAAGGANIIITYNKGQEEAKRVADEINNEGGHCQIMQIDVNALSGQPLASFAGKLTPTHVYYFASPHISSNRLNIWDSELFNNFCKFYLDAFTAIVKSYAEEADKSNTPITFFFPSTIFIDQPEKGFSEYATAKGAGEVLCKQLAKKYQNTKFVIPRLPRMQTDQTSSIIPIKCEPVINVMREELEKMDKDQSY